MFRCHTDSYIEDSLSISSLPRGGDPFPVVAVAIIEGARELVGEDSRSGDARRGRRHERWWCPVCTPVHIGGRPSARVESPRFISYCSRSRHIRDFGAQENGGRANERVPQAEESRAPKQAERLYSAQRKLITSSRGTARGATRRAEFCSPSSGLIRQLRLKQLGN